MTDNTFMEYQILRQSIKTEEFVRFKKLIRFLEEPSRIGLIREYRAYHWLKKKYPNDLIAISNMFEDQEGIDIVIERNDKIIKFAVSGPADKEPHYNCDYKIMVTDRKIYQSKIRKNNAST